MAVPQQLIELVERFDRNRDAYRSGLYNEAQTRREFIDPLFVLLGWDIDNKQGYAEAYKDVVHEDSIKIGGATKAPDYCFRIGGTRKFFLEAKKPVVNIKEEISPAFQLRRYAWSAKLPLSVLTDFEEFAAYDCRIKPEKEEKPSVGRLLYITYDQYLERWEEIVNIFSKDAVLKGSFDKFAESTKSRRGTTEVDTIFLKEIENWRELLARNIALRNEGLSQRELNFAVQNTIDRIIFLRICEDRGIELYGQLRKTQQGSSIYGELCRLFRRADDRYNSGLFHFRKEKGRQEPPDELSLSLVIDDRPLKDILKSLYYPDSPYEFSVLPADILGQVYEQFLGKIIRLTSGGRAVVEDKPEVKKAGGVYYTPTYIVDYIVRNTVGKFLEEKTPRQAAKLKILDPACGSGSFLIGAYQYLLEWHLNWYVQDGPRKHSKEIHQGPTGDWRLTTAERKRILLNNLYGVDIDPQAVEVTKLSLLLKVLEGETEQTITAQLKLFQERALPDLGDNIKCGNSLVGPDFYNQQQMNLLGEEERYQINVFDWDAEFPEIMRAGGFDAVIGNPPYVRQESISDYKPYFSDHYKTYHGLADLYVYFYEQALRVLKDKGIFGYISSSKFLQTGYGSGLRNLLTGNAQLLSLVDYGDVQLFKGATTYPVVLIGTKTAKQTSAEFLFGRATAETGILPEGILSAGKTLSSSKLSSGPWVLIPGEGFQIIEKIAAHSSPLSSAIGPAQIGIKTSLNDAFVVGPEIASELIRAHRSARDVLKPYGRGRDLRKWVTSTNGDFLICSRESLSIDDYPSIKQHLKKFEIPLRARYEVRRGDYNWWVVRQVAYTDIYDNPKIVYPDLCSMPRFALNMDGMYPNNTVFCIPTANLSILGYLNSRLAWYWITHNCPANRGGAYRLSNQHMNNLPVSEHLISNAVLTELVERMLKLGKQVSEIKTGYERTSLQRQIGATEKQIDRLVYELYGLTDEEIAIIEGGENIISQEPSASATGQSDNLRDNSEL